MQTYDVHRWAATFLEQLDTITRRLPLTAAVPGGPAAARQALHTRLRESEDLLLLLDYDGTLVPYTPTPELARPDAALRELLEELARRPRTEIHVVSGRGREPLEQWLGDLPIGLHAEHGFWSRPRGGQTWVPAAEITGEWRKPALAILRDIAARTPGSLVEVKSVALAWHYAVDGYAGVLLALLVWWVGGLVMGRGARADDPKPCGADVCASDAAGRAG